MYIDKQWRILTVGDGDLSFSAALFQTYKPTSLMATVYDTKEALLGKYRHNQWASLAQSGVPILDAIDVTHKPSFLGRLDPEFDLVIFQFPLLPNLDAEAFQAVKDAGLDDNLRHRILLRQFLINAFKYWLDPNGARLCFITSKDVKPYSDWGLDSSLAQGLEMDFLGTQPFDAREFAGYRIRNVDRDTWVKSTMATTFVYGTKPGPLTLSGSTKNRKDHCPICGAGPFYTAKDKDSHYASRRHQQLLKFEQRWQAYLKKVKGIE